MTAVIETTKTKAPKPPDCDNLFVDKYRGVDHWFAWWYDDVGRIIRRRLAKTSECRRGRAQVLAREQYDKYQSDFEMRLEIRREKTPEEIEEYAQIASFPRIVVAHHIQKICNRIARYELGLAYEEPSDEQTGQPGLQLFAERTGISAREAHRLIEDEERISVGSDTVDKICVQFGLIFDDFISESMEWAERRGRWQDRSGVCDPWPIGYFSNSQKLDEDLI